MPIYEYQCPQCQAVFEEWLSVSEATETAPCPHCKTVATHIISNTAFVLKGGGWYVTDYGQRKNTHETTKTPSSQNADSSTPPPASAENSSTPKSENTASA